MRPVDLRKLLIPKLRSWSLLSLVTFFLLGLAFLMLNLLSPLEIGPNGILAFFFILYLLGIVLTTMVLKLIRLLFRRKMSTLKSMYLAAAVAFAPVMLLALNTLNQLQPLDIILVTVFESLAIFYILRRLD